jgi:hypothetical protein
MESCTDNFQNKSFGMSDSKITMIQSTNLTYFHEYPLTPPAPNGGHVQVINHLPKISSKSLSKICILSFYYPSENDGKTQS